MDYRVILTRNGEYKKTFHKSKTRETAFKHFNALKEANKVYFPKRFINYGGIKPVEYKISIVKDYEEGDEQRWLRDDYGRLYKEDILFGKWTVLVSSIYEFEEEFYVFGHDPIHERMTIREIMVKMVQGINNPLNLKRIIVVHNKLVMHDDNNFEMVICKCKKDAQRLHHELKKATEGKKLNNLIFSGTAKGPIISQMYDLIEENTGWSMRKIRRTTTRP